MTDDYTCPVCRTIFEGQQVKSFVNGQLVVVCSLDCQTKLESKSPEEQRKVVEANKEN